MHFTILLQIQYENNFPPTSEHRQTKFVALLVFVCMNASFIYKFRLPKLSRNETPSMGPVAKQCIAKDIPSYESQLKHTKIAIH